MANLVSLITAFLASVVLVSLMQSQKVTAYPLSFYDVMAGDARYIARMIDQYINGNMDQDFVNERISHRTDDMSKEERCAQPMRKGLCRALIPRYT